MKIQRKVKEFEAMHKIKTSPEFRCLDLVSETGETAKELLKMTEYGKIKKFESNERIEIELGDCFFSLLCLANSLNIDLEKATEKAMQKYEKRITIK